MKAFISIANLPRHPLTAGAAVSDGDARLTVVIFICADLYRTEPQLFHKRARREARVEQLRRQRQSIGGLSVDFRQAALR